MKRKILSAAAVAAALTLGSWAQAQRAEPDNGRPNPYRAVDAAGNVYGAVVSYGGNLIRHERLPRTDLNSQAPQ